MVGPLDALFKYTHHPLAGGVMPFQKSVFEVGPLLTSPVPTQKFPFLRASVWAEAEYLKEFGIFCSIDWDYPFMCL